jgi:5-methylcytosine-specific restriction endonuclease McrA
MTLSHPNRIAKHRAKPRPGRLMGSALAALRESCWMRDRGLCKKCGTQTDYFIGSFAPNSYHMSHIKTKRIGLDTLDNVETMCGDCHRKFHNYGPSMTKPVPPKVRP